MAQTAGPWNWTGWVPKIQVGLAHARKTVQVTVESDTYQITVNPGITVTAPRTASRDIKRHKVSNYQPG